MCGCYWLTPLQVPTLDNGGAQSAANYPSRYGDCGREHHDPVAPARPNAHLGRRPAPVLPRTQGGPAGGAGVNPESSGRSCEWVCLVSLTVYVR